MHIFRDPEKILGSGAQHNHLDLPNVLVHFSKMDVLNRAGLSFVLCEDNHNFEFHRFAVGLLLLFFVDRNRTDITIVLVRILCFLVV